MGFEIQFKFVYTHTDYLFALFRNICMKVSSNLSEILSNLPWCDTLRACFAYFLWRPLLGDNDKEKVIKAIVLKQDHIKIIDH